jgi:hypothetical protein
MLLETEYELLAQAVDGGLSSEQFDRFTHLIAHSPEADLIFRQLLDQHRRLQAVSVLPVPASVLPNIIAKLPKATPRVRSGRQWAWVTAALAASVLLGVGVGVYYFNPGVQRVLPSIAEARIKPAVVPVVEVIQQPVVAVKPGGADVAIAKIGPDELDTLIAKEPETPAVVKPVEPREENIFATSSRIEFKPLKSVDVNLPTLLAATDFNTDAGKKRLTAEVAREGVSRVDLFSRNPTQLIEQMQAAAKNVGVSLFVESLTSERMKKPTGLTFAFYIENLTAEELAALLAETSKLVQAQTKSEGTLGLAHVITPGTTEQKDVKELVGVEFASGKLLKASPAEAKPISSETLSKVTQTLKKSEKTALLLTYLPTTHRTGAAKSAEVKLFLDKRGERLPNTTPALIVIR